MKTTVVIVFGILFSAPSLASCPEILWQDRGWSQVSPEVKSCIMSSESFQQALSGLLCSSDQSDVSAEYKKFQEYRIQYDEKLEEYNQATSRAQQQFLHSELRSIESEWMVFGFRYEILSELALAFRQDRECARKHQN